MQNSFHQLRFDISERVQLPARQPGIRTLVELDLYPDVSIHDEGNNLRIEGSLRLHGTYEAEGSSQDPWGEEELESSSQELSHTVPVEITLPPNRANVQLMTAEIEHFDYQLISPTELQIEAILLVDGFVPDGSHPQTAGEPVGLQGPSLSIPSSSCTLSENTGDPSPTRSVTVMGCVNSDLEPSSAEEGESNGSLGSSGPGGSEFPAHEGEGTLSSGPTTTLEKRGDEREEGMTEETEDSSVTHPTSWLHWLLKEHEESFTPMRMVIVQRSDTLDQLANRYSVSVSQLLDCNRLDTRELSEGQVLYVPTGTS
ncbi:LysM peptidoglycan-binding domain-containing protein [Pasteuria penetrans]|uniref:LysM peptidoglycan-binding domain-containing protein n=1 Tax=Pasteuria penetrans TaxID=86005 RepID=UPI000FB52EA2|nr:LysM peptidoglycan-binding domain-containing protein [Pasteuria penetrans]